MRYSSAARHPALLHTQLQAFTLALAFSINAGLPPDTYDMPTPFYPKLLVHRAGPGHMHGWVLVDGTVLSQPNEKGLLPNSE